MLVLGHLALAQRNDASAQAFWKQNLAMIAQIQNHGTSQSFYCFLLDKGLQ
jgi:hypothetical protein